MKIGIMTMHRVENIGSVLQAYALQHKLEQQGYEAEIIDYIFPQKRKSFSLKDIVNGIINILHGCPKQKRLRKLNDFRTKYLRFSSQAYSREGLLAAPPKYDIYCTGSDQVWNPKHIGNDTSFMLDFAPEDKPRVAYASSFATGSVGEPYFSLYSKYLRKYSSISVREQTGVDIVKRMTGKDAKLLCDPTLLLTPEEWDVIAKDSEVIMPEKYILVYLLSYMFNPRPGFYNIVKNVRQATGMPVLFYNGFAKDVHACKAKNLTGMGPCDFVKLFKKASFVITDSFHGAAFSSIYNVPMIGVVKDAGNEDGRIATLREKVGGKPSVVCYDETYLELSNINRYKCDLGKVEYIRNNSEIELRSMIEKAIK